jgi:hypothetical protein
MIENLQKTPHSMSKETATAVTDALKVRKIISCFGGAQYYYGVANVDGEQED